MHALGVRIATPVCELARNDIHGTRPSKYSWVANTDHIAHAIAVGLADPAFSILIIETPYFKIQAGEDLRLSQSFLNYFLRRGNFFPNPIYIPLFGMFIMQTEKRWEP